MHSHYAGLITYQQGLELQAKAYERMQADDNPGGIIIGCEHHPVITLGKRSIPQEEFVSSKGFEVFQTDRGGQATIHTPGQLVIYPIVPLRNLGISVKEYVNQLESTTVEWLQRLGIDCFAGFETGVFTPRGKIAFVGIRVEKGISRHGIAININNDLELFGGIRACGVSHRQLDSVKASGIHISLSSAFCQWSETFTLSKSHPSAVQNVLAENQIASVPQY